ncbi:MAG: transposase, partial [Terracidiphilus sp.]
MEDVLALYEKPLSEKEPVVCMDEKPVVLHAEVRPPHPMRPGRILRRDCEYMRRGTANAFCGVQPKAGRHFTKPTANRSSPQFADYLVEIVASYPEADTIHLVM